MTVSCWLSQQFAWKENMFKFSRPNKIPLEEFWSLMNPCFECLRMFKAWWGITSDVPSSDARFMFSLIRMYNSLIKEESVDPVLRFQCGDEVPPGTDLLSLSRTVWTPQKWHSIWLCCVHFIEPTRNQDQQVRRISEVLRKISNEETLSVEDWVVVVSTGMTIWSNISEHIENNRTLLQQRAPQERTSRKTKRSGK